MLRRNIINTLAVIVIVILIISSYFLNISWWSYFLLGLVWFSFTLCGSFFIRWNYHLTSLHSNKKTTKNHIAITFDDGNKSNLDMGSNKIFKQLNQLITASIKGDMFDASEFEVSYFKKDGKSEVHFKPKDEQFSEFIKSFHITFNTNGEVQKVKMIESSDDYTQIIFSNRTSNQSLPDATFTQ